MEDTHYLRFSPRKTLKSNLTQNHIFFCFKDGYLSYIIVNIVIDAILSVTEISPQFGVFSLLILCPSPENTTT